MEGGGGTMEAITTGIGVITTLVGDVFTMITGNPLLAAFVGAGLLGSGIGVFRKLKSSAK